MDTFPSVISDTSDTSRRRATWRVTWIAGPDAGGCRRLAPGDHVVGRAALAGVRCDDPAIEPYHLRLHLPDPDDPVGDAAGVRWCQLAGRRPVVFDGELVSVGTSVLHVTADPGTPDQEGFDPEAFDPEAFDPAAFDPAAFDRDAGPRTTSMPGGVVVRRGRRRARAAPGEDDPGDHDRFPAPPHTIGGAGAGAADALDTGDGPDGPVGFAGATAGLAVGVVLAVVLHQPLMLLMGAVGVLMSGGTWLGRRVRRRRRRRARAEAAAAAADRLAGLLAVRRARVAERCRADQPGLVDALRVVTRSTSAMWQRRPDHGDAFTAVAGVGDGWAAGAGAGGAPLALERVPVCADLGPGARVACAGPGADAMIRSLLVQLAVTTGPADWQLLVVGDRPDRWSWLTGLPHLVCTDDAAVVHDDVVLGDRLGTGRPGDHRHLLVLTDATGSLAVRTSALRRLLHARPDAALLVAAPAAGDVPAACTQVWITTSDGRVKVDGTPPSPNDRPIGPGTFGPWHLHGLGPAGARLAVGALAPWSDPEAPDDHERRLADAVDLDRLWRERGVRLEPAGVLAHWRRGRDANGAIADAAPIGSAADGTVDLDLVRDGPHGLIAGTTGSGKSELLRTIVLSSAIAQPPDRLAFVLVDFKGGATFDDLARLPHVVGVVTDLEPRLAERVLRSLRAEVTAREHLLRSHGCADLDTARRRLDVPVVARLVIVVDEFAALALEHPELLHGLVDIARRGRSLGIHLLLATQRPGGVVSDEIRTNTDLRIALRLHEPSEAIDVVGDAAPASIRRSSAGRAVVRLGPGELVTFQTARAVDTARTIDQIVAAAREGGLARPSRPWCDPLPDELLPGDPRLADGALGLVDRPDQQRQHPFDWRPADGHLLVAGAVGSGVTTALAGLAVRRLASDAELVVIDAIGGSRWDEVAVHPRCAVVARLHDVELVDRALRRAATPPPAGGRLVVIDGIGVLRRELDGVHRADAHDRLDALLVTTPPGVTLLLGSDAVDGLAPAIVGRCARRLVAHLHDPTAAALLGLRVGDVPPAVPGRVVDTVDATVVQLAPWPAAELARAASPDAVPVDRVRVLPPSIDVAQVADGAARRDDEQWWTAVGLAHHDLSTACVTIARGEHAVVVGPPRSGRTNALAVLRRGWTIARPDAAQVVVSPRRVPASELAAVARDALAEVRAEIERGREVLLVVDDAERLPDDTGELAALAASPPDGLVIVAACRPEALRAAHGSWVTAMRRHRRGVVFAGCDELDVESLGVRLPRRPPLAARPGLAWLIGDGEAQLAQLATIGP